MNKESRLRLTGKWVRVRDVGFRNLLVFMGVPWLMSFVAVRSMGKKLGIRFTDEDPDKSVIMSVDEHEEIIPTDGTPVDVEVTKPFVRTVQVSVSWLTENSMTIRRDDPTVQLPYKKFPSQLTVTRTLLDDDTIESKMVIRRLTDNETAEATIVMSRDRGA